MFFFLKIHKMASSLIRFTAGPKLFSGNPRPPPPPRLLGGGDSCFKAECFLQDPEREDKKIATFRGYDKTLGIVEEVENACKLHAKTRPGHSCTSASLVFLPSTTQECSGQLYFVFE